MKLNLALTALAMAVLPVIAAWSMQTEPDTTAARDWLGMLADRSFAILCVAAIFWWIHKVGFPSFLASQERMLKAQQETHERDWQRVVDMQSAHAEQSSQALRDIFEEMKELRAESRGRRS